MPRPNESQSVTLRPTDGVTAIVRIADLRALYRPTEPVGRTVRDVRGRDERELAAVAVRAAEWAVADLRIEMRPVVLEAGLGHDLVRAGDHLQAVQEGQAGGIEI